jgi:release factor glutamine methyltransferase
MQIKQALTFAITKLKQAKISSALLDSELILCFVLKKEKEFLFTYPEKKLTATQAEKFHQLITKRAKYLPVAYITNKKSFFGLDFFVNPNVLIPRPETETLVEEVLKITKKVTNHPVAQSPRPLVVDVGTGSGCIIISLAKAIPHANFFALDKSAKALTIAKKNAKLHKVTKQITFLQGNLFTPILKSKKRNPDSEIIITANLPYGWNAWKNNSSVDTFGLKFEPAMALFTGNGGLELYEQLLHQLKILPNKITAFFEFDPRQTIKFKKLIKKNLPYAQIEIISDLCGQDRIAKITLHKSNV